MAFKTFTAGSVLTAADVNDYLMEQVVITCTSGTRPGSPNEGMTIYETDTDYIRVYNGSAWRVVAGVYTVSAAVEFAQNATGNRQVHIYTNGSEHSRVTVPSVGSGLATRVSHSAIVELAAGGYVECFVFQDSGGPLNITNGANTPNLAFVWNREGA